MRTTKKGNEIMDTSKPSLVLNAIEETLRQYLSILPFKRLHEHLSASFERDIEGCKYHFTNYASPMATLMMSGNDRVFVIPLTEKFDKAKNKFWLVQLFLGRVTSGGEYGTWSIYTAEFVQAFSTIPNALYHQKSEIISCRSVGELEAELSKIQLPLNFIQIVESAIEKWIADTITKREVALEKLKELKRKFPLPKDVDIIVT